MNPASNIHPQAIQPQSDSDKKSLTAPGAEIGRARPGTRKSVQTACLRGSNHGRAIHPHQRSSSQSV